MGLMDVFKAKENKQLQERIAELEALLSPEHRDILRLRDEISSLEQVASEKRREAGLAITEADKRKKDIVNLEAEIEAKKAMLVSFDEEIMLESFGLYTPRFKFTKAEQYKKKLDEVRQKQKSMISAGTAVLGSNDWTVNGSASQGKKMIKDMQKLLLRAFNGECDDIVEKVKYSNFDTSIKRIYASKDAISKLGSMMKISISEAYCQLKIDEVTLAFEYATKKQEEKEAEKAERERLREEARLQKEIEEERKKLEKEQTHYMNALAKINSQLSQNPNSAELLAKKAELEEHLTDTEKALKDVDYREANKRAGYVYIISNVGAFGENVYKIGMTRRLDPQDRIDELGDASVPFAFDVHAMIFTDDAPKLEAALHHAFEDKKVNMVNPRREFFRVTLDEIKAVIRKNYDKTVEFVDYPEAEQWRISAKMRGAENETPVFPTVSEPQEIPTPNPTDSPKNLAENAIEYITSINPTLKCTYSEKNHIYTIMISDRNNPVGRLRVSRHNALKYDFSPASGGIVFFSSIDSLKI